MSNFYIYIYKDPRKNNEPIYVGKGKGDRAHYHLHYSYRSNPILQNKIKKFRPVVEIYKDNLTEEQAFELEKELIQKYGRHDKKTGTLCNLTDGGEGCAGLIHTEEHRKKNGLANMGTYEERYGKDVAERLKEERRNKMLGNTNGKNISAEGREKIRNIHKGKKKGKNHLQNLPNEYTIIAPNKDVLHATGRDGLYALSLLLGLPKTFLHSVLWKQVKNTRDYTVIKGNKHGLED